MRHDNSSSILADRIGEAAASAARDLLGDLHETASAKPEDVRDFIRACLIGDLPLVRALVARVFNGDRDAVTAELALARGRFQ